MARVTYPLPPFFRSVITPSIPSTIYWDDGVSYFRLQVRENAIHLDQRITSSPGWGGSKPTDWSTINTWT